MLFFSLKSNWLIITKSYSSKMFYSVSPFFPATLLNSFMLVVSIGVPMMQRWSNCVTSPPLWLSWNILSSKLLLIIGLYLEEELYVADVLELDKLQWDDFSFQLFLSQENILSWLHGVCFVKVESVGLVLKNTHLKMDNETPCTNIYDKTHCLRSFVCWCFQLETMNLDTLVER